ncbi:hypothetical protein ACX0G9_25775 [Flavitalea flava]
MNKRTKIGTAAFSFMLAFALTSCGSNESKPVSTSQDSVVSPAPDNSSATNSSLADTAYKKDSAQIKRDSIKK